MTSKKFWMLFSISLLIAFLGWIAPVRQMPLDYDAMIWRSIPSASAWLLVVGYALLRYKWRGLVLLLAAPNGALLANLADVQPLSFLLLRWRLPITSFFSTHMHRVPNLHK